MILTLLKTLRHNIKVITLSVLSNQMKKDNTMYKKVNFQDKQNKTIKSYNDTQAHTALENPSQYTLLFENIKSKYKK